MTKNRSAMVLFYVAVSVGSYACAAPIAACNAGATQCFIPENIQLQLPFTAIAGDVRIVEADGVTLSDVFRIFNNVLDTGAGTGLGNLVFLFSADEGPLPTTFSANVRTMTEGANGITSYLGNGTTYVLGIPEPSTFPLLGAAFLSIGAFSLLRRRCSIL